MQTLPGDILRYICSYDNVTVREILQFSRVNKGCYNALQNKQFWKDLYIRRLTDNPSLSIVRLSLRILQGHLNAADTLWREVDNLDSKPYNKRLPKIICKSITDIVMWKHEKQIEKVLAIRCHPRRYNQLMLNLVKVSFMNRGYRGESKVFIDYILQRVGYRDIYISNGSLTEYAAREGLSDLLIILSRLFLDIQREHYGEHIDEDRVIDDMDTSDQRILEGGIKYLSKHSDDDDFADYLSDAIIQDDNSLQNFALCESFIRNYQHYIDLYRDDADTEYLTNQLSEYCHCEEDGEEFSEIAYRIIDFLPYNQDLIYTFQMVIRENEANFLNRLLGKVYDSNFIQQVIDISLAEPQYWRLAVTEILLPHMTSEQKRVLMELLPRLKSDRGELWEYKHQEFVKEYDQIVELVKEEELTKD